MRLRSRRRVAGAVEPFTAVLFAVSRAVTGAGGTAPALGPDVLVQVEHVVGVPDGLEPCEPRVLRSEAAPERFLAALGALPVRLGIDHPRTWAYDVALVIVGVVALAGGTWIVITGEAIRGRKRLSNPRTVRRFRGVSARLIGPVLILVGPIVVALSAISLFGGGDTSDLLGRLGDSTVGVAAALGFAGRLN